MNNGDFHFEMDFHPPFINKSTQMVIFSIKNGGFA